MAELAYDYVSDENDAYELIDGEVYMMARPSINHADIEFNITSIFKTYLRGKRCRAFNEVDVYLSPKDQVVPDVIIVCNPDIVTDKRIEGVPDLVVEILSHSTEMRDRSLKLALYAKYGVKECWLVDPIKKSVEVYHLVDGQYVLRRMGFVYTDEDLSDMNDKDRALALEQSSIKVSLYDDFTVEVKDIFEDVT